MRAQTATGLPGSSRTTGNFSTHFVIGGDGPWLVLIHGVGLDLHMWSRQAAVLEKNRRVLRYDLIGHGETPPAGDPLSLDDFVSQLHELLNLLGVERAGIVGFSMGALVAQAFALEHPAVTGEATTPVRRCKRDCARSKRMVSNPQSRRPFHAGSVRHSGRVIQKRLKK